MADPRIDSLRNPDNATSIYQVPPLKILGCAPTDRLENGEVRQILEGQWGEFWRVRNMGLIAHPIDPQQITGNLFFHNLQYDVTNIAYVLTSGVMSGELGFMEKPMVAEDMETNFCADFFVNDEGDRTIKDYMRRANTSIKSGGLIRRPEQNFNNPSAEKLGVGIDNNCISLLIDSTNPKLANLLVYSSDGQSYSNNSQDPLRPFITQFPSKTTRHVAVLVGLPANTIGGIVVGGKIEKDMSHLARLRQMTLENGLQIPILNVLGEQL